MNLLRVSVLFLAVFCANVFAQTPEPPEIAAKAYLLVDITANQVLAQRQADAPVEPASLTKLMTLIWCLMLCAPKKSACNNPFL